MKEGSLLEAFAFGFQVFTNWRLLEIISSFEFALWIVAKLLWSNLSFFGAIVELHATDEIFAKQKWMSYVIRVYLTCDLYLYV
jgi:hypothetical protein